MTDPGPVVLDASALLAFLFREAGHETVDALLPRSRLSAVNLAEVLGRFARDGHDPQTVLLSLEAAPLEIVPFTRADAIRCASLVPITAPLGLSFGDRACLALALTHGIPAVTADRSWAGLELACEIVTIR